MLALGALFVSVAFAAGYVTLEVLHRRAPAQATASRGRRWRERPRDEPAARRRRARSAARAREPVSAEVAEGHVAAPEADGARRLSRPDGAASSTRSAELGLPVILLRALRLFSRHDAAACSSGRCWRIIGYMLPGFWLSRQIAKRKKLIANGLPDALDLLIVCVEAGMGLDQAHREGGRGTGRVAPGALGRARDHHDRDSRRQASNGGVQELRRAHEGR